MELDISEGLKINADNIVTARTCVIGQSGSGKSYAIAVICEELCKNNIGFCIIDTEGEYFSLKEKFQILWVGLNESCDLNIMQIDLEAFADEIVKKRIPVIFDISEVPNEKELLEKFLTSLYFSESKYKSPYLLIIEEADKFVPQHGKILGIVDEIARRGRKRGLGLLIASQRPALVNKNILSQCGNQIIGKLTIQNDLDAVSIFFPNHDDLKKLPHLKPGEFFVSGDLGYKIIKFRKRLTEHKAITPKVVSGKFEKLTLENLKQKAEKKIEKKVKIKTLPIISRDIIYSKLKKKFSFPFKRKILSFHLELFPIYEFKIKYLKKTLFKKSYLECNVYLDGISGDLLSLENEYKVKARLNDLLNLKVNEIKVLFSLDKDKTVNELSIKTGLSVETIRKVLKSLQNKKLVSNKRFGKHIFYFSLIKIKKLKLRDLCSTKINFSEKELKAKILSPKFTEESFRNLIKAINSNSEIIEFNLFYYPIFIAEVLKGKKNTEIIYVDGRTSKLIQI